MSIKGKKGNIFALDSKVPDTLLYQYSLPKFQCVFTKGEKEAED